MVTITGNTYPVRISLARLGGRWSPSANAWLVPDDKAEEARALVAAAGPARPKGCGTFRRRTCKTCGCRINYGVYCGKCEFGN